MICLAVTYEIRLGNEEEAAEHFRRLAEASREEPGCMEFAVHRVIAEPRTFFLYERYVDAAAFDAHRQTPHFDRHVLRGVRPIADSRVALVGEPLDG
jgi:quinol monooxygenase YgiN